MDIAGIRSASEIAPAQRGTSDEELGKTEFLELMIAQISNQDPLDPAKNEEFVAQLAQFSSVEGIQNLNTSLESVSSAIQSSLTMDAAALVGRSVVAPNEFTFFQDSPIAGTVNVGEPTSNLRLEIYDDANALVRSIDVGTRAPGEFRFSWNGTNSNGETVAPGRYQVKALAQAGDGQKALEVSLPDRVVSVTLGADGAIANLATGTAVRVGDITEIQ